MNCAALNTCLQFQQLQTKAQKILERIKRGREKRNTFSVSTVKYQYITPNFTKNKNSDSAHRGANPEGDIKCLKEPHIKKQCKTKEIYWFWTGFVVSDCNSPRSWDDLKQGCYGQL